MKNGKERHSLGLARVCLDLVQGMTVCRTQVVGSWGGRPCQIRSNSRIQISACG